MTPPPRHWRSYTDDPLPTPQEALAEPFAAFPSWFLRIECDRCGKVRMLNEAHVTPGQRAMPLRVFLVRARHEGCGGQALKAELVTGTESAGSAPCGGSCCGPERRDCVHQSGLLTAIRNQIGDGGAWWTPR